MNDIIPPKRSISDVGRVQRPAVSVPSRQQQVSPPTQVSQAQPQSQQTTQPVSSLPKPKPQHLLEAEPELPLLEDPKPNQHLLGSPKKNRKKRFVWWAVGVFITLLVAATGGFYLWYSSMLQPISAGSSNKVRIQIVGGTTPSAIGTLLEEKQLIKSRLAFDLYTRISGNRGNLQAGVYNLAASESTPQIVEHLVSGNTDDFSITFLPGATLTENRKVLLKAGYSEQEIDKAFTKAYDHPLFTNKPASSDLEGYIYGETYSFPSSTTVEQILIRTFDEFYGVIQDNSLVSGFESQGLNLYEGLTLASIIQREVPSAEDQKQVAQVFFTRLKVGMQLGSDVTAYYGADKIGVSRSVAVDTPYNTRLHTGMPPGPIGTPGLTALQAVAAPAQGDFIYFLSGDDEVTYFAKTDAEHEANIANHCSVKCSIP
jgi:UPF0755 protein